MLKKTLVVFGVLIVTLVGVQAQQVGTKASNPTSPIVLTAADYAEIYQLYGRYPYAFDGGLEAWGAVFTPDGVHINAPTEYFKGREMLNAFSGGQPISATQAVRLRLTRTAAGPSIYAFEITPITPKNLLNVGHFITNIMLEPTPEGVKSKAYLMGVGVAAGQIYPRGIYFDTIVKTSEGWEFQMKHFIQGNTPVPETVPDVFKTKPTTILSSR